MNKSIITGKTRKITKAVMLEEMVTLMKIKNDRYLNDKQTEEIIEQITDIQVAINAIFRGIFVGKNVTDLNEMIKLSNEAAYDARKAFEL